MAVSYFAEDVKMPAIKKRETTDWIRRVASGYGKKCGDIAYIFCSDEKILEVNKAYLQHDYYTDVITFDYTEGDKISGESFITLHPKALLDKKLQKSILGHGRPHSGYQLICF